ncbi:MAG: hypothetical protein ABIK28_21180, partial [Planctomycetota bacterium]
LVLYRKCGGYQGKADFSTWFYRIVVNACLKIRQKRRPADALDDVELSAKSSLPESEEAGRALRREIAGLPLH